MAKQLTNHQSTNDLPLFFIYKKLIYIDLKIISLILQQQQQKNYVGSVPNMQLGANCVSQTQNVTSFALRNPKSVSKIDSDYWPTHPTTTLPSTPLQNEELDGFAKTFVMQEPSNCHV